MFWLLYLSGLQTTAPERATIQEEQVVYGAYLRWLEEARPVLRGLRVDFIRRRIRMEIQHIRAVSSRGHRMSIHGHIQILADWPGLEQDKNAYTRWLHAVATRRRLVHHVSARVLGVTAERVRRSDQGDELWRRVLPRDGSRWHAHSRLRNDRLCVPVCGSLAREFALLHGHVWSWWALSQIQVLDIREKGFVHHTFVAEYRLSVRF